MIRWDPFSAYVRIDGNYLEASHHFFIKLKNWLKSFMMSSKFASGLSGKQSTMLGQEGRGPEEGMAESGGTNESFRDTLEVRASEVKPSQAFLDFERQFGVDIQSFKLSSGYW